LKKQELGKKYIVKCVLKDRRESGDKEEVRSKNSCVMTGRMLVVDLKGTEGEKEKEKKFCQMQQFCSL